MITLFTTTKDFVGLNRQNQLNAIRSWLFSSYKPQVIIFGKSVGFDEMESHPNLISLEQVKITSTGAPFANEMFDAVSKTARHKICCYLNADIILTDKFFETVQKVHAKLKNKYLLVGERVDVDVKEDIIFKKGWEELFFEKYSHSFKAHPPYGSDFFVFPAKQYTLADIPELYIGRPGWDLWMIYNARKRKYKTIDLSPSVQVIHQNHDYSHKPLLYKSVTDDPEATINLKTIHGNAKFIYTLNACNYNFLPNGRVSKNYARDNFNLYVEIEKSLNKENFIFRCRLKKDAFYFRIHRSAFLKLFFLRKRKFNIGSGKFEFKEGWLCTDKDSLNILNADEWKLYLRFLKLDNIVAEHVWEHLTDNDTELANKNCFRFLKRKGILRIAVPDGYNPDKNYLEQVCPGGIGDGAEDHKVLYNYKLMMERLKKAGFKVNLLEYWDEQGKFHFTDWSEEGGRISRSKRWDYRNKNGKLNYTSLIVDAIKP